MTGTVVKVYELLGAGHGCCYCVHFLIGRRFGFRNCRGVCVADAETAVERFYTRIGGSGGQRILEALL